jgi:hypothetical protein
MNMLTLILGSNLALRFLITLLFVTLLIITSKKTLTTKQHTYTYFVISVMVFFLCFTLNTLDMNLGMAMGLFAIFGIIRYRTETIRTEDMTYLFAFIGLAVINALTPFKNTLEIVLINVIITACIILAQRIFLSQKPLIKQNPQNQKTVLTVPMNENIQELETNLKIRFESQYQKTVKRIELQRIDDLKQQIIFTIFH